MKKQFGLLLVAVFALTAVSCASGSSTSKKDDALAEESVQQEEQAKIKEMETLREQASAEGTLLTFTSQPAARGDRIRVVAGNDVLINLDAPTASSILADGVPSEATYTDNGETASLSWSTSDADVSRKPYRVSFSADNGGSLAVKIYVMRAK